MKTICYVSNFSKNLTKESIDNLINLVDTRNNVNDITGLLIVRNKQFFQILEGRKAKVDTLFNKIEKDSRHKGVIKLLDVEIDGQIFKDYNSGKFETFQKYANMKKLYLYFNWIKNAEYLPANEIIQLTTNFLKQNP
ncbi:MAG: BLUF domain-containing protein [Winogradskyella sp.]|uniref:BLUF domain-containing protein n=1 Tax=Winogradskyella sp. TaxID=1883156 RepID=UPI000F3CA26F|nr:BLUF domain-containing protein [Winogradskyella sp.]RNC84094.1 MAG: BLUF domain-containing protein [Winogradskyella sp.]